MIVVYGATGFTGQLVVNALVEMGRDDWVVAGRNEERVAELADRVRRPYRIADTQDPRSLEEMARGARVIVSTAGPFLKHGEPVVRAALEAGAHFVDTTGEQAYVARLIERYHGLAKAKRLAVVNAHAFEFALGISAASVLCDAYPDTHTVDVFNFVAGNGTSRGTQKSGLAALGEPALIRRRGRLVERGPSPVPMRVRMPGRERDSLAVPFPGTEALFLSRQYPSVRDVTTNLVLPKAVAWSAMGVWAARRGVAAMQRTGLLDWVDTRIDSGSEGPSEAARLVQTFTVLARGRQAHGRASVSVRGADPYGITGILAAQGGAWLADTAPLHAGVVSSAEAFGARRILDALAPHGVTYDVLSS